jgi:hypothetical protein
MAEDWMQEAAMAKLLATEVRLPAHPQEREFFIVN